MWGAQYSVWVDVSTLLPKSINNTLCNNMFVPVVWCDWRMMSRLNPTETETNIKTWHEKTQLITQTKWRRWSLTLFLSVFSESVVTLSFLNGPWSKINELLILWANENQKHHPVFSDYIHVVLRLDNQSASQPSWVTRLNHHQCLAATWTLLHQNTHHKSAWGGEERKHRPQWWRWPDGESEVAREPKEPLTTLTTEGSKGWCLSQHSVPNGAWWFIRTRGKTAPHWSTNTWEQSPSRY